MSATQVLNPRAKLDADLAKLLAATVKLEGLTAKRDEEIAQVAKRHNGAIDRTTEEVSGLEASVEAFYLEHKDEIDSEGKKSVQLTHGLVGTRRPTTPALVPFSAAWKPAAIAAAVRKAFGAKFFRKPKAPELNKNKLKQELTADQLAKVGLKLDDTESFYFELNRLDQAEKAAA